MLEIERFGGLVGFGTGSRTRCRGRVRLDALTAADRARVEAWLAHPEQIVRPPPGAEMFRYRITRSTCYGQQSADLPASIVPAALSQSVHEERE